MSRKFNRILSIMMVAIMVIAMAAACGMKEEAAESAEREKTDNDERQIDVTEDVEASNGKMTEYGVTEEELRDLYSTVEATINSEYIQPNNIQDFRWLTDEVFWSDCTSFLMSYAIFLDLQSMDLE